MSDDSREAGPSWLKIGGIACGILLLFVVLSVTALVTATYRSYGRALAVDEELAARYGALDAYPIPDSGGIPTERMTRFVAVRRALLPRCQQVSDLLRPFRGVETESNSADLNERNLFRNVLHALPEVPRMGLVLGDYVEARNRALLEQQMGLGEYSFIFVVGYVSYLAQTPAPLFDEPTRGNSFQGRVFPGVATAIDRFVTARGLADGPWVAARDRLRQAPGQPPFADGLPPELETSLAPFRDALSASACPAAAELDVTITVRRQWFGFDHK